MGSVVCGGAPQVGSAVCGGDPPWVGSAVWWYPLVGSAVWW